MKFSRAFAGVVFALFATLTTLLAGPGLLDPSFSPQLNGPVFAIATQPDGRTLVGGNFTTINLTNRSRIARVFPDGALDTTFQNGMSGASSTVNAIVMQPDGRILIGGEFFTVNGVSRNHVARLNFDGSLDLSFVPVISGTSLSIYALAVQPDNKVIIGGNFLNISGNSRSYIARLNADGSIDTSFNPSASANSPVFALALQSDGKIVMGGSFSTVFGINRNRLARLLPDGTLDLNFMNGLGGASGNIRTLYAQADGKILAGGDFTSMNSSSRSRIARLNSDGTTETNFNSITGLNGSVYAMEVQNNGSIVAVGDFVNGQNKNRIARLFSDGTAENAFLTNLAGANILVRAVGLQGDGKILVGGDFTTINGTNRSFLARLYSDLYPPEIITQPVSRNITPGSNVTFSVNVSNPTAVNYQWRRDGINIPGATLNAYTVFNAQTNDSGLYSVYLSNGVGASGSSNAVLNVGIPPSIFSQPTNITVVAGQSASFAVGATGWPLYYQWRKLGAVIPGATNASLTFSNVVITNAGTYNVTITNFLGTNISFTVSLGVLIPAAIVTQPTSRTVGEGSNTTFTVSATGTGPLRFQWFKNDETIQDATNSTYNILNAQLSQSGDYKVMVTNSYASVTSQVATLTVLRYPPIIVTQPQNRNVPPGSDATFTVGATGTTLAFQWFKDDVEISGANASSFSVTNVAVADEGGFTVVVTNSLGSVTSVVARLKVGFAPVIVSAPTAQSNSTGATLVFSGSVTGSVPLLTQWLKDGVPLTGETNSTLTISNVQPGHIGYYQLTATNDFGDAVSTNAALELTGYTFAEWQGLLGYYPFDQTPNDQSAFGNHGVVSGAINSPDRFGAVSGAYRFDGSDDYIDLGNPGMFNFAGDFTLSLWVQTDGVQSNKYVMGKYTANGTNGYGLGTIDSSSSYGFIVTAQPATATSGTNSLNDSRWHQIVAVYGRNAMLRVYRDGIMEGEVSISAQSSPLENDSPLLLGKIMSGQNFGGGIDDVRVYNRALSTNEVQHLYALEADLPVITQQPVSQTVSEGNEANFSIAATSQHPLTYQWRKNGGAISGATNSTYSVANAQLSEAGDYSVAISNGAVEIISESATLTINQAIALLNGSGNFGLISNQFGFSATGPDGQQVVVESSTNLIQWEPIQTNVLGTNAFHFEDAGSSDVPQKFYRLRGL